MAIRVDLSPKYYDGLPAEYHYLVNMVRDQSDGFWYNSYPLDARGREQMKLFNFYPVTKLFTCDVCGAVGGNAKVQFRPDVRFWNYDKEMRKVGIQFTEKSTLCMRCWESIRPIVKNELEAEAIREQIKQFNKEYRKWQRLQKQASLESTYVQP